MKTEELFKKYIFFFSEKTYQHELSPDPFNDLILLLVI